MMCLKTYGLSRSLNPPKPIQSVEKGEKMAAVISSLLGSSFLSTLSPRPRLYSSLFSSSSTTLSTKISQTPSKPSSLFPLSFAKNVKAGARLNRIVVNAHNLKLESFDIDDKDLDFVYPGELPPFEIIDNINEQSIVTLKRELMCETIEVEVLKYYLFEKEVKESWSQLNIPLLVKFTRHHGRSLEFYCVASSTNITVHRMRVLPSDHVIRIKKEPFVVGPKFSELNEIIRKAFYNYIEARGIDSSFAIFLQDYMIKRDGAEYLASLKSTST
ncbi:uncharacterized protein At2g39795, mitochondrial-like [Tasmannia lanceolata]|uniref:uncharacterized protein At2g39795, mitochondrial-like n=1 Tax=Tasmannia lanceolata TaxID=3420 RepID=UPI004062EC9A